MKSIVAIVTLASSLVLSNAAFGRSIQQAQVLAEYAINLPQTADSNAQDYGILTLKSDRTLTVQKVRYAWGQNGVQTLGTKKVTLSKAAMDAVVFRMIANLSTAEVKTTHQDFVCMMIPMPGPSKALKIRRGYDYQTQTFAGALEAVNDNTGCWSHTHVNFANEWDQQTADALETALEVLALQLAAN